MKAKNIFLTGLMVFLLSGCFVKSLHPFYKESDLLFRKELLGTWTGNDSSVWKIEQGMKFNGFLKPELPDNKYLITYTDKNGTAQFDVSMFKLGNKLFLDFYPEEVKSSNDLMNSHLVPMHTVAKIDMAPDKLAIQWYNEEWLIGLFKQNRIRIAHEKIPYEHSKMDNDQYQIVLTASTDDLQKFMLKYSDDPKAFNSDYAFVLRKNRQR